MAEVGAGGDRVYSEGPTHPQLVARRARPAYKSWYQPAFEATLKSVCPECNSGWMSKIETAAKPLALPLMLGHSLALAPEAQQKLAVWAYLKCSLFLTFEKDTRIKAAMAKAYPVFYELQKAEKLAPHCSVSSHGILVCASASTSIGSWRCPRADLSLPFKRSQSASSCFRSSGAISGTPRHGISAIPKSTAAIVASGQSVGLARGLQVTRSAMWIWMSTRGRIPSTSEPAGLSSPPEFCGSQDHPHVAVPIVRLRAMPGIAFV